MDRITTAHLNVLCGRLNRATKSPAERFQSGSNKMNVGHFFIEHGHKGSVGLVRISNENGGEGDPLHMGKVGKRELFYALHAFIEGIQLNVPAIDKH